MVTVCTLVYQIILQLILFFLEKFQPARSYSIGFSSCMLTDFFCRGIILQVGQKIRLDWPGRSYNSCILTNFSELVMLFEIANINWFPFPAQQNKSVLIMKHPNISRIFFLTFFSDFFTIFFPTFFSDFFTI